MKFHGVKIHKYYLIVLGKIVHCHIFISCSFQFWAFPLFGYFTVGAGSAVTWP